MDVRRKSSFVGCAMRTDAEKLKAVFVDGDKYDWCARRTLRLLPIAGYGLTIAGNGLHHGAYVLPIAIQFLARISKNGF